MNKYEVSASVPCDTVCISDWFMSDRELSLAARGLLVTLKGIDATRNISMQALEKTVLEGCIAIRTAPKKLISKGYVERTRIRDKGRIGYMYKIIDTPIIHTLQAHNND